MIALLALPATAALLPRRKAAPADDERPVVAPAAYRG
jgi:hypothetical protein